MMILESTVIKNKLTESVLQLRSQKFIPFLISSNIKTSFPNKTRFYQFFSHMIKCTKQYAVGELRLNIKKGWEENLFLYDFYDEVHRYAVLSILVKEENGELYLEVAPF